MTPKVVFQNLCNGFYSPERTIFRPILMHFIARYAGGNYAQFASDHRFLVETNLRALDDFDIDILDIDWQIDPQHAFEVMGPDVIRCGNIDPRFVMDKTPEEVYSACKLLCDNEKGRKFILSAGCEIIVSTPHENLMAMRKASYRS